MYIYICIYLHRYISKLVALEGNVKYKVYNCKQNKEENQTAFAICYTI